MSASTRSETIDILARLRQEVPEVFDQAQVVGDWVWLEFTIAPDREVRENLKALGFHWNPTRQCWQHPCGVHRTADQQDAGCLREMLPIRPASRNARRASQI